MGCDATDSSCRKAGAAILLSLYLITTSPPFLPSQVINLCNV